MAPLRSREFELTLEERLRALRSLAVPIAQSGLAAGLAWYVAHDLIGHPNAFFAPIAALIALAVVVVVPVNPVRRAREAGRAALSELAGSLEDIAGALETHDVAAVRQALNRARAAEATVTEWQGVLEMGAETARLSPPYWR